MNAHPFASARKIWIVAAIVILALLAGARIYLNTWLLGYVNRVLNNIEGYEGSAGNIGVDLYRGAYRIYDLKIYKKNAGIPTPFITIEQADLSIQWTALFHGRIVSSADLLHPAIHFAVKNKNRQIGNEVDWTKPIKELMPIDINVVMLRDGNLTFQDFASNPQVNLYIHHMEGNVQNLRNVVDKTTPLPSTIDIRGTSIGEGNLSIRGRMNILKDVPDVDLLIKLENVHLPAMNNFSNAYANIDFKDGDFSLYSEFIIKDKRVSGYIKPIARHISVAGLKEESNPIKAAWEAVASAVIELFTNHATDQFATRAELTGNLDNIRTDTWSTIAGIFHNAFIASFKKGLDETGERGLLKQSQ